MPKANPHAARICANCRYQTMAPDNELRCANPRDLENIHAIEPSHSCDAFRISFTAAKALAFPGPTTPREGLGENWEEPMRRHLAARARMTQLHS
ncbi:MAG: hypothetical protein Q7T73_17150 [Beijerinckiaceae bacterium]|nr:hypothetical protein [Beijerinckiaceae bacterium]